VTAPERRLSIVGTLMVRDEVDIIAAMVEHHIDQGLDQLIVTDNGSVDGTTEVLQQYADTGFVELHHDPVHRKQQHVLVTGMARRARIEYGADWVINADADEFWVPRDKNLTLRKALEAIPLELNAFPVPVTNMVGPPARRGAGFDRLLWRDKRTKEQLNAIGIFAQPTENALHRGDPEVVVAQGNHFVNLESTGSPDPAFEIEVLHVPWRSWAQHERRVLNTGRAYDANPDLNPSPNHHMMNDYRRYQAGRLWYLYLLRLPTQADLVAGEADGRFLRDPWLAEHLHALVERARRPDLLAACIDGSDDGPVDQVEHADAVAIGRLLAGAERERDEALQDARETHLFAERLTKERDAARRRASAPPRLVDDWTRLIRRTGRAVWRRIPFVSRRP
jgi:glycosyl transferase family 2